MTKKNIFRGLFTNPSFYGIWIVTLIAQIVLAQYGSFAISCVALTFEQWMLCLLFSVIVLLWHQVLNSILMTCHISKRDGRSVYELTSSVDLDTEEQ
ncbi:unnamed protein product [Rotaria sp. Silwood2]|nr:unnamed protein product [Rotaria sp. Silwood2]CAF3450522.1 unnamed protein product [Rotaria sp. Silwood2]CAF4521062.1 unnamed protein product [Rotaria sp. Silwood2]